jgi:hypothetical protein
MAEQAVLARRRANGRYDLSRSRWAGTNAALAAVTGGTNPAVLDGVEWRHYRSDVSFPEVVESLDYLSTALCYRAGTGTTTFLCLWFGLPLPDESAPRTAGALVAVNSLADARRLRARFRTLKGALADGILAGALAASTVPFALAAWVTGQSGREVYIPAYSGGRP